MDGASREPDSNGFGSQHCSILCDRRQFSGGALSKDSNHVLSRSQSFELAEEKEEEEDNVRLE